MPHVAVLSLALLLAPAPLAAQDARPTAVALPQCLVETETGFAMLGERLAVRLEPGALRWILADDGGRRREIEVRPVEGDAHATPIGERPLPGRISSFHGPRDDWRTRATFGAARYAEVWPGIALDLVAEGDTLKGTWTIAPGADASRLRLRYEGADSVEVDAAGRLVLHTSAGDLVDDAPVAWQVVDGARRDVAAAYAVRERGGGIVDVAFALGAYDPALPLLVDPAVIVQAGFLGGMNDDLPWDVHVGDDGSVYVAGSTQSPDFPVLVGPDLVHAGPTSGPYSDAFVAKLDPTGTSLVWAGFIGGSEQDTIYRIDVDAAGHLYIGGTTNSSEAKGFPSTGQPNVWKGSYDAFVARVSVDGSALDWCGYIGGNGDDRLFDMDVDASGRIWAVGRFASLASTLPVAIGPVLTQPGGAYDGFVARVSADGADLDFCGYLGGDDIDDITGVVVDPAGGAWFSGLSWSQDFPVIGPLGGPNGSIQAVLGHVADDGTHLTASGLYGGSGTESPGAIALDASGAIYVSGLSFGALTFPASVGPNLTPAAAKDGYVAKFAPGGGSIVWAGFTGTGASAPMVHDGGHAWIMPDTATADPYLARIAADGTSYDLVATLSMPADTTLTVFDVVPAALSPGVHDFWIGGWSSADETTFPVVSGPDLTANGSKDTVLLRVQIGDDAWTDLGSGLAGTNGVPLQTATGTLAAASPFTIALADARANSTAWFVLGLALLQAPFKGGVMVPDPAPPALIAPLPTSALGEVGFGATWPSGVPGGVSVFTQWWIVDPVGPVGFAASNALQGTTP